ncbi:MAG: GDSL-type esterase/lipase family protein [candidate division KSB1 bacterium]|nr:GDSL-type esterase/lipase family protein [candidate division KSB1 bacterium]
MSTKKISLGNTNFKRYLFTAAIFALPALLIALLEGLLFFIPQLDDNLFITLPYKSSPYYGINPQIAQRYFSRLDFLPTPRKDLFLKKKPAGAFRIFVLGGSTTAGFPYGNNITFPRILHRRLQDAYPERKIEVVNTAMTAINSYALLDFMEEILRQKPDLLLIYAGHNEYYGALGAASVESFGDSRVLKTASLKLRRLRLYRLIRKGIHRLRRTAVANNSEASFETVMSRIVKEPEIPLGSRRYLAGCVQFERNMEAILRKAEKSGVPVILSELVSNLRDQPPFLSVSGSEECAAEVYLQAQEAEQRGEYAQAASLYERAKDLDALRFRAPEEFNAILHRLADRHRVPIVPMKKIFAAHSPHGLIGATLITEHLHPNIDGYFLMAEAFLQEIFRRQLLDTPSKPLHSPAWYRKNWGCTPLDSVYAALTIAHLKSGWPFRPIEQPNRFFAEFKPKTREEELIVRVLQGNDLTLEQAHLILAKEFQDAGQYDKAFREYRALTFIVPYLDLFYEPMIDLLVQQKAYSLALAVLFDALHYQDSAYVYKWIGQILLVTGETRRGLNFLEESLKRNPHDAQAIYNACRGYYNLGDIPSGDRWLKELSRLIPASKEFKDLQQLRLSMTTGNNESKTGEED